MNDARQLGPQMLAEGWRGFGGDSILWIHTPSRRVVMVDGPWDRDSCNLPDHPGEVADPKARCYSVICYRADEFGNPLVSTWELDGFRCQSYGLAVRVARETRARILAMRRPIESKQLTLDDFLEARHG